jgi:hypothetical protein
MPTAELPWAQVITSVTDASVSGIGNSPTGIKPGSTVLGFFLDGEDAQRPMILGTLPGLPPELATPNKGFNDPSGAFPRYAGEPDTNRLARNENEGLSSTKNAGRTTNVDGGWSEPESAYAAQYPYNSVRETESGHVFEVDDTPGAERIHEYHKAGTFYEIDASGNKVTRVVGNNYEIVAGNDYINVKGSCNITIDSNVNMKIKGDWNVEVDGNKTEVIKGSFTQTVDGTGNATWKGKGSDISVINGSGSTITLTTHLHTDPPTWMGGGTTSVPI